MSSTEKGATLSCSFNGTQIGIRGLSNNKSSYAKVTIKDQSGRQVLITSVDFYSKYEYIALKFLSPVLAPGQYTLTIEVLGEHTTWTDKSKTIYGSTDNYITIEELYFR